MTICLPPPRGSSANSSAQCSDRYGRPGQGKSSGYRTLVATNKGSRWVFVFGFPKNARSNIDEDETEALKKLAAHLLSLTPQALGTACR